MRFDTGLHRARIQRGIDLTDLAARTRLSPRVVQRIDEGRFAELPAGVYARAYVRAFASEVGLDPKEVLQELEPILPAVEDPIDGLREAARQIETSPFAWVEVLPARLGAASIDAVALLLIDVIFIKLIAVTCGIAVASLIEQAGAVIGALCTIRIAMYFLLFSGVGGCTPGAWVCKLPPADDPKPVRLRTIVMRTLLG